MSATFVYTTNISLANWTIDKYLIPVDEKMKMKDAVITLKSERLKVFVDKTPKLDFSAKKITDNFHFVKIFVE